MRFPYRAFWRPMRSIGAVADGAINACVTTAHVLHHRQVRVANAASGEPLHGPLIARTLGNWGLRVCGGLRNGPAVETSGEARCRASFALVRDVAEQLRLRVQVHVLRAEGAHAASSPLLPSIIDAACSYIQPWDAQTFLQRASTAEAVLKASS